MDPQPIALAQGVTVLCEVGGDGFSFDPPVVVTVKGFIERQADYLCVNRVFEARCLFRD